MKRLQAWILLFVLLTTATSYTSIGDDDYKTLMQRLDTLEQQEERALIRQAHQKVTTHNEIQDHKINNSLKKLSINKQK